MIKYFDLKRINASFGDDLKTALSRAVNSGWYIRGREVEQFENEFAAYVGTNHCIGVGNGLDALTAVLMAWKQLYHWDEKDEVILPDNTFIATALAVTRAGLTPVLCEPHRDIPTIDETQIEQHITPHTRVIIPVHLYGLMCNMDAINKIAKKHRLKVLEDACQAHGAIYHSNSQLQLSTLFGRRAGNYSDAAAFSFYPAKNLGCMGDGGAVTTNDAELAERVRAITNYGQTEKYRHDYDGFNSRLDELQAAVLSVKLRRLDRDNTRRIEIAHYYSTHICHPAVELLPDITDNSHVYHIYAIKCKNRNYLQQLLLEHGIQTQVHYPVSIHRQKAYSQYANLRLPIADHWADDELSLPLSPLMTDEEVQTVVDTVNQNIF
jgi:dTDP-4-amino-4,6-dideoxygalactose transaminase